MPVKTSIWRVRRFDDGLLDESNIYDLERPAQNPSSLEPNYKAALISICSPALKE